MKREIEALLRGESIEYFGILPFSECKVIHPELLERCCKDWTPKSAILLLVPYYSGAHNERNVSLYAVPRDYHCYFHGLFQRLEAALGRMYPQYHFKGFADHSPIGETMAAAKVGLGVIGDKFQLIHPIYGSYTFLGEILTDMIFERYDQQEVHTCSHCGACRRACPMKEGCLSELTQKKGELSKETEALILRTGIAWGCDLCRTSCPRNDAVPQTPIDFFREELITRVTTTAVEAMSKDEFASRAYSWRGKKTILRNLAILENREE